MVRMTSWILKFTTQHAEEYAVSKDILGLHWPPRAPPSDPSPTIPCRRRWCRPRRARPYRAPRAARHGRGWIGRTKDTIIFLCFIDFFERLNVNAMLTCEMSAHRCCALFPLAARTSTKIFSTSGTSCRNFSITTCNRIFGLLKRMLDNWDHRMGWF